MLKKSRNHLPITHISHFLQRYSCKNTSISNMQNNLQNVTISIKTSLRIFNPQALQSFFLFAFSIDADEEGYCNKTLLNAFCRKSDDILDLNNINTISGMALDGCMAQKVINVERLEKLADDALLGSYFESLDGLIIFDSCLIGVNGENLSLELTNPIEKILPGGLFHGRIKELIVKDFTLLRLLQDHIDAPFCDTIHIYVGGHTREEGSIKLRCRKKINWH